MTYKLFLDDIKTPDMVFKNLTDQDFIVVRNFKEFTATILKRGLPDFISFDNDLGIFLNRSELAVNQCVDILFS